MAATALPAAWYLHSAMQDGAVRPLDGWTMPPSRSGALSSKYPQGESNPCFERERLAC